MRYDLNELSSRKKQILKAIIEAHIELGEPVGSKYLMEKKDISCSSATIRNEMSELEELGYLEQPHTSAGRIPTELGYRFYVDSLAENYNLTNSEITELQTKLNDKKAELDSILDTAVKLASSMTNYTALVVKPRDVKVSVKRYELMAMDKRNVVLIMALDNGNVKTKHLRSANDVSEDGIKRLSSILNEFLSQKTAEEITLPMLMAMENAMGEYSYLVSPVVKAICETLTTLDGGELKVDGINRLLSYPEYYDFEKLKDMLSMFEQKNDILEIVSGSCDENTSLAIPDAANNDKVQVYIGSENMVKTMNNSTLVFKTIKDGDKTIGAIGVIGPTRMDYSKVIATIDNLTNGISSIISSNDEENND